MIIETDGRKWDGESYHPSMNWLDRVGTRASFACYLVCGVCGRLYAQRKSTASKKWRLLYCSAVCEKPDMGISKGAGPGHPNQGYAGLAGLPSYYTQASLAAMQANMAYQAGHLSLGTSSNTVTSNTVTSVAPKIDRAKIAQLAEAEPRKATAKMPDLVQPIVAWRAWKVGYAPDGKPQLEALGVSGVWPVKQPMSATCGASCVMPKHAAPCKGCSCGMWAFKTRDTLLEAADGYGPVVLGEVYLWGKVVETESGYRAQYAYPKELWLLDDSLEELGFIYNVPIRTVAGAK